MIAKAIELMAALYDPAQTKSFDVVFDGATTDGVVFGIKKFGFVSFVIFRGSHSVTDWLRNVQLEQEPIDGFPQLGAVHKGFAEGMVEAVRRALRIIGGSRWIVAGHSLGGARADIAAGIAKALGEPPIYRVTCAPAKAGSETLRLWNSTIGGVAFRNRADIVPLLPVGAKWCQPIALTQIDGGNPLPLEGPIGDHSIIGYGRGYTALLKANRTIDPDA